MANKVFKATSIDGYIADKNGNIDWLHSIPNPDGIDMGYSNFMSPVSADIEAPFMRKPIRASGNEINISKPNPKFFYL